METVRCHLCGADSTEILFEGYDRWHHLPGRFPVRRCRVCGLIYLSPRPDRAEIGQYYPETYAPYSLAITDEPSRWQRCNRRYNMLKRLRLIQSRVRTKGRVLEVGCATGNFLDTLRRHGWDAYGVETNSKAAAYAYARLGLTVFNGELEQAGFPDRYFDLAILWDVLEHVHEPRQTLLEVGRVTRPGGTLVLTLPNPDSLEARIFGAFWAGWDVPRHLHVFPQPVISRMLHETGWQMAEMVCVTGRMWLWNLSLRHWLADNVSNARLRRCVPSLMGSLPLRLLSLPFFIAIERLKKGSIMAIFARRL